MTLYLLLQHDPSGEVYAARYRNDEHGTITGICGPLTEEERDAPGDTYNYDDQPEDVEWANELDAQCAWRVLHTLPATHKPQP